MTPEEKKELDALQAYLEKLHKQERQDTLEDFIAFAKAYNVNITISADGIRCISQGTVKDIQTINVATLAKIATYIDILYLFQMLSCDNKEKTADDLTEALLQIIQFAKSNSQEAATNFSMH